MEGLDNSAKRFHTGKEKGEERKRLREAREYPSAFTFLGEVHAWDGRFTEHDYIREQIEVLLRAGYTPKDISIFVLYNWEIPFEEMEMKRIKCFEWGVQIADCRFRPLNQLFDHYNPNKFGQTVEDYYIHESAGWSDHLVKIFRQNVREQNICVRHGVKLYARDLERKKVEKELYEKIKDSPCPEIFLKEAGIAYWFPGTIRRSRECNPNLAQAGIL